MFVAYAPADSELREKLYHHVSTLRRSGAIRDWSDEEILPGEELANVKREKLNRADVVLLLISSDFLGSYGDEMTIALERHRAGKSVVIPIIPRRCHWESTDLGELKPLPKNGRPVRSWTDIDEAFYSVVQGIKSIVEARSAG
ncbi:toll/interleukin-1 receptor domain-containing protein [Sorangium cellulosum]|uniref:toll/interleukin-1 receptor domain-containing protein n=1 Tax=Sorangium cellulosum TaxID=56 RepID=UPI003D9A869C